VTIDKRAVRAILEKVNRSQHHFTVLKTSIDKWNDRRPYRFLQQANADGSQHALVLHFLEEIPIDWSVRLGEAIHDLRSALDQCVYWLSVDFSGGEVSGTSFPVYTSHTDFARKAKVTAKNPSGWSFVSGMHKVRGVGAAPLAFIEALQPYPDRNAPHVTAIHNLNKLWNQDKHRLVHLWGLRITHAEMTSEGPFVADCVPWMSPWVLHEGAEALTLTCPSPRPDVEMSGTCEANVAIQAPGIGDTVSLWDIYKYTANVVAKLVGAIGHPDTTIDLATWDAVEIGQA
jgi:hypothetical protein